MLYNEKEYFSEIDGDTFVKIDERDIRNGKFIVPEGIKKIDANAFYGCKCLFEVKLPETLENIGVNAFASCINLDDVILPQNLKDIGAFAFKNCAKLKQIIIPEEVDSISEGVFEFCVSLEQVTLPEKMHLINKNAFSECVELQRIDFPERMMIIRDRAFYNCKNLTNIVIPKDVFSIGTEVFSGCTKLKKVSINSNITTLDIRLFEDCENLEKIKLPDSIRRIDSRVFCGCKNLELYSLPSSLEYLGDGAFLGCEKLYALKIPAGVTEINENTFCRSGLIEVFLPKGLTSIGKMAFAETNIGYIDIPDSVKEMGMGAFQSCKSMHEIRLSNNLKEIPEQCFYNAGLFKVDIPNSVKKININAFRDNYDLEHVKFGDNISSIDVAAFYGCFGLKKVHIPKNVDVADYSFDELTKLNFGDYVIYMGLKNLMNEEEFANYDKAATLKHFDKFLKWMEKKDLTGYYDELETNGLLTFAYNIGCMSGDDKRSQRACNWLQERIENFEMMPEHFSKYFLNWNLKGENVEFSEFLFGRSTERNTTNFDEILQEENYGDFLTGIYEEYTNPSYEGERGRFRDKEGRLRFRINNIGYNQAGMEKINNYEYIPTPGVFKRYFKLSRFNGVNTEEDKRISDELSKHTGLQQKHFDRAKSIMKEFHDKNIPTNIVGKHLNENIEEKIKKYKKQINNSEEECLSIAQNILNDLSNTINQDFSYDWLEKNDPMNFCLGSYCNCCTNLSGMGYGIMRSVFVDPNVQNLVVKDKTGKPVMKSTLYVNREKGYGVFNTVEISNYKTDEEKQKIYEKYMEGIREFAKEYNKENPDNHLKKISVGIHLNELDKEIRKNINCSDILTFDDQILKGLDFGKYGIEKQIYQGDWKQEGQFVLWREDNSGERNHE